MATLPTAPAQPTSIQGLGRMAPLRQALSLVALAGSIAVGVAAALWIQAPSYVALNQTFSPAEMPALSEALERAGIDHKLERGGTVLVESSESQNAEFVLADAGISSNTPLSMEKLYGGEGGLTQTREDKRQRLILAKEGDLAQTISRMKPIASAKVHLAMPLTSPFQRRHQSPSASVMLEMRPGRRLNAGQVESIRQLVAQGVEAMDPSEVVVTDQSGRMLGRAGEDEGARETDFVRELEARLRSKISNILTPITGAGGFTAEVTAQVDFTTVEAYTVTYDGDTPGVRSRSTVEESNGGVTGGIPGALSNQPGGEATAPEEAGGVSETTGSSFDGSGRRRRSETVNNELDKSSRYKRVISPSLTHLSTSVVLDDHRDITADGTVVRRSWTPEEINGIAGQIRSAIGFNIERQDVVTVTNTQFAPIASVEPLPEIPIWQQSWVLDMARQAGVGLLALTVVFGVFKPFMRNLVNREIVEREVEGAEQARLAALAASADSAASGTGEFGAGNEGGPLGALGGPNEFERSLEAVRSLVSDDPKRAANVMKEWVGGQPG